jgi:hypothetical protein
MVGALVAAATVESHRAVAVLAGVLIAGVRLPNRKDKGCGAACKAALSRRATPFSVTFAPRLPQIFRFDARWRLTSPRMTGAICVCGSGFVHRIV